MTHKVDTMSCRDQESHDLLVSLFHHLTKSKRLKVTFFYSEISIVFCYHQKGALDFVFFMSGIIIVLKADIYFILGNTN